MAIMSVPLESLHLYGKELKRISFFFGVDPAEGLRERNRTRLITVQSSPVQPFLASATLLVSVDLEALSPHASPVESAPVRFVQVINELTIQLVKTQTHVV